MFFNTSNIKLPKKINELAKTEYREDSQIGHIPGFQITAPKAGCVPLRTECFDAKTG